MPYSPEQLRMAQVIVSTGQKMGMSQRDITIGLMAAFQESDMRNIAYGDRDSLGLFQQRPSQGWGTRAQVMDPQYATQKFFHELAKVHNRDSLSMSLAAQAVQRSAFPMAYAKHEGRARQLLTRFSGSPEAPVDLPSIQLQSPTAQPASGVATPALPDNPFAEMMALISGPGETGLPGQAAPGTTPAPLNAASLAAMFPGISGGATTTTQGSVGQTSGDGVGAKIVAAAQKYLGVKYAWGGTSAAGIDCSGLVQAAYKAAGIDLPRISFQQANSGRRTDFAGLRAGDLVAWDNSSRNAGADHIAIYLGNNQIIEAPRPGKTVRVRNLGKNEGAWGVKMGW